MTKIAKTIIENKETVGNYEKIVKSAIAIIVLGYIAVSNGALEDEKSQLTPNLEILKALTSSSVWLDFWSREGIILAVFMTLFLLARSYNNYLDEEDAKILKQQKQERKRQKMMSAVDGDDQDEDDSSDSDDNKDQGTDGQN